MTEGAALGPSRVRSLAQNSIGVAVSVLSLGGVAWWARGQHAPKIPTSSRALGLVAAAIALYVLATLIRGWRWHEILRRAGVPHRRADAFALTVVGYMGNAILPARGGEAMRVLLLAQRSGARRREVLGSILAERILDAATLVAAFAVLTWTNVAGAPAGQIPAIVGVAVLTSLTGGAVLYLRSPHRHRFRAFEDRVRPFARASRLLLGPVGAVLAAVTVGLWTIETLILFLLSRALDAHVSFVGALFLVVLVSFFLMIPAAPGYVGTFEASLLFGLRALGVRGAQALSLLLLWRFVLFVPITAVGLALVFARYGRAAFTRRARSLTD